MLRIWRKANLVSGRKPLSAKIGPIFTKASIGVLIALIAGNASAEEFLVSDQSEYQQTLAKVEPGDVIVLKNGTWTDFPIVFSAAGTPERPITLRAETPGAVHITGQSNLKISGEHLVISGLTFRDGNSPDGEVISFRTSETEYASHVHFTENVIDRFNKRDRADQDHWVVLYGSENRFSRNALIGKTNKGMTLVVRLDNDASTENGHIIEKNYFGPRDPLGGNGGETIRIGTSFTSRVRSGTIVRENFFDRCSGEVEIISLKSEGNLVTQNTFFESRGSVVFRHGGHNVVSRNVFLGNGVRDTGGIRIINDNQTVTDNYLEGLTGLKFTGALVIMNGVPNSPQNRYHQVENANISNNTFVDVAHLGIGVGTDEERSAVPINSALSNNILISRRQDALGIFDDITGLAFSGNISDTDYFLPIGAKTTPSLQLVRNAAGLLYPNQQGPISKKGAPTDLRVTSRDDVGPKFYEKPVVELTESNGEIRNVGASEQSVRKALEAASPGDTLVLPPRTFAVSEPFFIDKPITIRGRSRFGKRTTIIGLNGLFRIRSGADLTVKNVRLEQRSERAALFHAIGKSYTGSFQLKLDRVKAFGSRDLQSAAALLSADPETFASSIEISDLELSRWPGDVINLDARGREGWYLSDHLSIIDSVFTDISGSLVIFGRDGRDESTFGPRFTLTKSTLTNVASDGAAIVLSGIDGVDFTGNSIATSGSIDIKRRVLGYPFAINGNKSDGSASLSLIDVHDQPMAATLDAGLK
ncbi:MAG: polysaccharide lyase 6 family protein [Pseudomonadota bacterium]